jgi:ribosome recycling factor
VARASPPTVEDERKDLHMSEHQSYEEKIQAIKNSAREASAEGVGEKHDRAVQSVESQRKELERSEKIGAFRDGVKAAIKEWLTENKEDVIDSIGKGGA